MRSSLPRLLPVIAARLCRSLSFRILQSKIHSLLCIAMSCSHDEIALTGASFAGRTPSKVLQYKPHADSLVGWGSSPNAFLLAAASIGAPLKARRSIGEDAERSSSLVNRNGRIFKLHFDWYLECTVQYLHVAKNPVFCTSSMAPPSGRTASPFDVLQLVLQSDPL